MKDLGGGLYQSGTSQFRAPDMQVAQQVDAVVTKITPDSPSVTLDEKLQAARRYIKAEEGFAGTPGIPIPGDDPTVLWGRNLKYFPFSDAEKRRIGLDSGRDLNTQPLTEQEAGPIWEPVFLHMVNRASQVYGKEFYEGLDPARFAVLTSLVFQMDDMRAKFPSHHANTISKQWDRASEELLIGTDPSESSRFMQTTPERAVRSSEILRTGVLPPAVNGVPLR